MQSGILETSDTNLLERARKILGDLATDLSDEELKSTVTEMQFLLDSWLDEFEREIFDGKTLTELLATEVGV